MSMFSPDKIDRLSSRLASLVSTASEKVKEAAEKTLSKDSPLCRNLREAVSDKNWGCSCTVLGEIARSSFTYHHYPIISKVVWDAIAEPPKKWRRILKGLTLLEYLLKNGSEKFVEESRERSHSLKLLQNFSWREEGRDKGAGIREKAEMCCLLSFDSAVLAEAREKAAQNRDKYIGISSATSFSSSHAGLSSNNLYSNTHSNSKNFGTTSISSSQGRFDRNQPNESIKADTSNVNKAETQKSSKPRARGGGKTETSGDNVKKNAMKTIADDDLLGLDLNPSSGGKLDANDDTFASAEIWGGFSSSANSQGLALFDPPPSPPRVPPSQPENNPTATNNNPNKNTDDWGTDFFGSFQSARENTQNQPHTQAHGHQPSEGFGAFSSSFTALTNTQPKQEVRTGTDLSLLSLNLNGTSPAFAVSPGPSPVGLHAPEPVTLEAPTPQSQQFSLFGPSLFEQQTNANKQNAVTNANQNANINAQTRPQPCAQNIQIQNTQPLTQQPIFAVKQPCGNRTLDFGANSGFSDPTELNNLMF